ncbi:MAG TPA: hypothetical protein VFK02_21555 [Kofleriaceae bacterium]|nr:hypothetical protein [Kofleriaceae bacterium]
MRARLGASCLLALGACGGGGSHGSGTDAGASIDAPGEPPADAAPDGPPQGRCPGVAITGDGVLDLDVRSLALSGRVTLAGAALPDEPRGLELVETRTGATAEVAIAADGTYATTLGPGIYDVRWRGGGTCARRTSPCIDGTLRSQIAIATSGALDLDVPRVQLSGRVQLDGAVFPSTGHGALRFSSSGSSVDVAIDAATASYSVVLLPGRYDIAFADDADCAGPVPCNAGVLRRDVEISASGALDLDLASVHVSGKLTVNGQPWTAGTGAAIELSRAGEPRRGVLPVGADGSYDGVIAPGRYEVRYRGDPSTCGVHAAAAPCNAGVLRSDATLTASGALDLDVPMVAISGALSLAGSGFPATASRGSISFGLDGDAVALAIAGSAPAERPRYEIALVAGHYAVGFVGPDAGCAPPVPCNAGTLRRDVALTADGALDLDVPTVQLAGVVTANGAALPVLGGALRGGVRFVGPDTGSAGAVAVLSATGTARYAVALLPGRYDVRFEGSPELCLVDNATSVPCNRATLRTGLSIAVDGALDLDLRTARVTGKVSLDGGPMPVSSSSRATLAWQLAGEAPVRLRSFGDAGMAGYAVTLLRGQYVASYAADPSTCGPGSATPCLDQPLAGCP